MEILFKCLLSTRIIFQFPELLRELSDLYSGGKKRLFQWVLAFILYISFFLGD
jgi:hypothetical protein